MAHAGGRPSKYTKALAAKICKRIADGESLRAVCRAKEMPDLMTVLRWKRDNEEFRMQYDEAKQSQVEHLFNQILEIADDTKKDNKVKTARDRLRVDTRKWFLSKVAPKVYGDKLDLTTDGKELPTPIIPLNVQGDHSNAQDSGAK